MVAEPGWVTAMMARIAAGAGGDADVLAQICRACAQGLPVSGAAISVMPAAAVGGTGWASSEVGVRIEELHLTLGEGPYIEAFTTGRPVVAADLEVATRQTGWPVFAAAAVEAGARAVFAFPLQLGAIRIGVLAFYRVTARPLSGSERSEALIAAERATLVLLSVPGGADGDADREPGWLDHVGRADRGAPGHRDDRGPVGGLCGGGVPAVAGLRVRGGPSGHRGRPGRGGPTGVLHRGEPLTTPGRQERHLPAPTPGCVVQRASLIAPVG
jgi:hypothetical protein